MSLIVDFVVFFFLNDPAPTDFYPLPLHDALPIWSSFGSASGPNGIPCSTQRRSVLYSGEPMANFRPPPCGTWAVGFLSSRLPEGAAGKTRRPRPSDRKSTRLNSSHSQISYAVFCL